MDKTSRALIGVEDNAEEIRALKIRMEDNKNALESRLEEDIGALKGDLEEGIDELKSSVEENIDELSVRVENVESGLDKLKILQVFGQNKTYDSKSGMSFGTYRIYGPTIFIMGSLRTVTHEVYFGDQKIYSGVGLFVSTVDSGEGELRVFPPIPAGSAFVIGAMTKTG